MLIFQPLYNVDFSALFEKLMVPTITWSKTKINPISSHIYNAACPLWMTAEAAQVHIFRKCKRLTHESVTRCVTRCKVTWVDHVIKNSMGNEIWLIWSAYQEFEKLMIRKLNSDLYLWCRISHADIIGNS